MLPSLELSDKNLLRDGLTIKKKELSVKKQEH